MLAEANALNAEGTGHDPDEMWMLASGVYSNLVIDTEPKEIDKKTGFPIYRVDIFYI